MFKATIDTNRIVVTNPDKEIITSGSVNVNFIQFSFSEDWADLQKTVLFQTKKAQIPIILEGTELVYTMPIPWEVCLYANESINVGAYGTRMDDSETLEDEEIVLPTVWGAIPDKVRQGVIVTDPTPSSPTYDAYQLLLKTISDILENGVGGGSVVTVEKTDYGHLLTITDVDGEKTVEIRDGVDGVSPTVSVTKIDGGHKVTITDANGAQSFDVMDGEDRQDGTGGGGDADVINRCVWIYEAGNDIALFSEGNTNVASPNEFIGHKPTVSNNNVGLILVDNKLYWIKFNITAANDNSVTQVFTNSPILIGPDVGGEISNELITIKNTSVTNVSQLPMDKFPCALHMVNSTFYYSFSNDIIYVASFPGNIAIWTMDGKIVFFIYGDDGEIIVNQTTSFVDGASLVEQFYTKNEIDSKLANITINDELVTIKDTNITNISQLPIDKSCCVHFVNSFLLYNFVDDIVYIKLQPTSNSIVVFTIDGAITTIYYDYENGDFVFTNTATDAVATAKYLYENYYEKTEVDNKIANIELTPEGSIPSGGIIIWSGATVPDGWALCDGTNGTPDLRGRFVLGESDDYSMGKTGGSEEVTLTVDQLPSHSHMYPVMTTATKVGNVSDGLTRSGNTGTLVSVKTETTGFSKPHPNMPPYYTLAYIMKL